VRIRRKEEGRAALFLGLRRMARHLWYNTKVLPEKTAILKARPPPCATTPRLGMQKNHQTRPLAFFDPGRNAMIGGRLQGMC
jgi:hypothetical protein